MLGSGASSSLHIEAEEDVPGLIPLNFLHLNTAYIYYKYTCLPHSTYRHKAKQEAQVVAKPKRGSPPTISSNSDKTSTITKQTRSNMLNSKDISGNKKIETAQNVLKESLSSLQKKKEGITSQSQLNFNQLKNLLYIIYLII